MKGRIWLSVVTFAACVVLVSVVMARSGHDGAAVDLCDNIIRRTSRDAPANVWIDLSERARAAGFEEQAVQLRVRADQGHSSDPNSEVARTLIDIGVWCGEQGWRP